MKISSGQVILLVVAVFLSALFARAQLVPDALSLVASPASPSPGQTVTVQTATPTFDKNTAVFSWVVDGALRKDLSGLGKDSISLTAGNMGSTLRVGVEVSRNGGEGGSSALTIVVSDLSLPWFAETYAPRWYKGKALPVANSVVGVAAVPQITLGGRTLGPQELIFRWDLDDEEEVLSGIGKEVLRVKLSDLPKTTHRIKVAVEDVGKRIIKEGEVFLIASEPKAVIYPSSPLGGGEWRSAAGNFTTSLRGLLDFVVEPFFFSTLSKKNLAYRWEIAGSEIAGAPQNPSNITLNTQGLNSGALPLSVSVDDKDELVSPAFGSFNLYMK